LCACLNREQPFRRLLRGNRLCQGGDHNLHSNDAYRALGMKTIWPPLSGPKASTNVRH
jgi:hypothetical protein